MRYTGKQWHEKRTPFRKNAGLTSYQKRAEDTKARAAVKAKEKEMQDEKEADRQVRISPQ
jgi:rRNA-processing protein CGR1